MCGALEHGDSLRAHARGGERHKFSLRLKSATGRPKWSVDHADSRRFLYGGSGASITPQEVLFGYKQIHRY